jgi:selenocysteine lyase/cysteine desulfurase
MNTFAFPGTPFRPASLLALLLAVPSLPGRRRQVNPSGSPRWWSPARVSSVAPSRTRWRRIGPEAKLARLRWLRDRWLQACAGDPRVRLLTRTADEGAGAIATVELRGQDPRSIAEALRVRDGIFVRAIAHPEFRGLRVTPNLFNSAADLDRFAERLRVHLDAGG